MHEPIFLIDIERGQRFDYRPGIHQRARIR